MPAYAARVIESKGHGEALVVSERLEAIELQWYTRHQGIKLKTGVGFANHEVAGRRHLVGERSVADLRPRSDLSSESSTLKAFSMIPPQAPQLSFYEKLDALARNYWWCWQWPHNGMPPRLAAMSLFLVSSFCITPCTLGDKTIEGVQGF